MSANERREANEESESTCMELHDAATDIELLMINVCLSKCIRE